MTVEEIRELIHLVTSTGVAELEVQRGENRVWIKRTAPVVTQEVMVPAPPVYSAAAAPAIAAVPQQGAGAAQQAAPAVQAAPGGSGAEDLTDPSLQPVKAPIVGTFYEAASPGAPPFVSVGDKVKQGSVLCIIESMKLMNEIESELAGTVVKKLVENGQPVEYGETLFLIKPN